MEAKCTVRRKGFVRVATRQPQEGPNWQMCRPGQHQGDEKGFRLTFAFPKPWSNISRRTQGWWGKNRGHRTPLMNEEIWRLGRPPERICKANGPGKSRNGAMKPHTYVLRKTAEGASIDVHLRGRPRNEHIAGTAQS